MSGLINLEGVSLPVVFLGLQGKFGVVVVDLGESVLRVGERLGLLLHERHADRRVVLGIKVLNG